MRRRGVGHVSAFSHFDETGAVRMVDVGAKPITARRARASAVVRMAPETLAMIADRRVAKGDVCQVARLAAILAAKRTAELIPLCHPVPLECVEVEFEFRPPERLAIYVEARVESKTGVEMEALTGAAVAGLTVYDMCKSVDRTMVIESIQLEEKSGGRSGDFRRQDPGKEAL